MQEKKRFHNIDILRFLFAISIVYYHIFHTNIVPYIGNAKTYTILGQRCSRAGSIVECFTVIGGFFLYQSFSKNVDKPFLREVKNRFVRLWPVYAVSLILTMFINHDFKSDLLTDLFFLRATGISLSYNGILWYVGPFFWSGILLFAMLKYLEEKKRNLLIAVLVFVGFIISVNCHFGAFGRETICGFISLAIVRVYSGMGLGCLIGVWYQYKSTGMIAKLSKAGKVFYKLIFTIAEVALSLLLIMIFFTNKVENLRGMEVVVVFATLFVLILRGNGYLYQLLDCPYLSKLGIYSYSIYIMQQPAFNILKKTLWLKSELVQSLPYLCLIISLVFCIIVGVLAYYIIEKPIVKIYKKYSSEKK